MDKVLKIAQKLKTFTLDDLIIMGDLEENFATEVLNQLIIEGKIKLTGKYFEYVEMQTKKENYRIIDKNIEVKNSGITLIEAVEIFLDVIKPKVTHRTFGTYKSLFNSHIIPFFKFKKLKDVTAQDVCEFNDELANKDICAKKVKNVLALLNQLIKHFQNEGWVDKTCVFEIKRVENRSKTTILST